MKEFYINPGFNILGFELRIIEKNFNEKTIAYVNDIIMTKSTENAEYIPPSIILKHDEIQSLINELWRNGIRPTNQVDESGKLIIMKNHLEDMRKLVFKDKYENNK